MADLIDFRAHRMARLSPALQMAAECREDAARLESGPVTAAELLAHMDRTNQRLDRLNEMLDELIDGIDAS